MGAARAKWDEAKHFRGYHGRFAAGSDRSPAQLGGVRGDNAFSPPTPAAERRARKERVPAKVRELRAIHAKRARGEQLSRKEHGTIQWASPRKMAEQRAKTGDTVKPLDEAIKGERSWKRPIHYGIAPRTGIKKTFAGKAKVERGNYRELLTSAPGRPGSFDISYEDRVRRSFDWPTAGKKKTARSLMSSAPKPAAPPSTARKASDFAMWTDSKIRDFAKGLGITPPPRAGRNQIVKLILEHGQ